MTQGPENPVGWAVWEAERKWKTERDALVARIETLTGPPTEAEIEAAARALGAATLAGEILGIDKAWDAPHGEFRGQWIATATICLTAARGVVS